MKGNKKLLVVAALLLLITVSFTTYAIYKSSVATDASVTAAKWSIEFLDDETEITTSHTLTFGAADCQNDHVASGKIAPGAECRKTVTLDANDSEVDVTYAVEFGTPQVGGSDFPAAANDLEVSADPTSGTITWNNGTRTTDFEVVITWDGEDDSTADTKNSADTSIQGQEITVPVTLVAKQVVGSASSASASGD